MSVSSGYSSVSTSGNLLLQTANAGAAGRSGYVVLSTGTASNGNSGSIRIGSGAALNGRGGSVNVVVGSGNRCVTNLNVLLVVKQDTDRQSLFHFH